MIATNFVRGLNSFRYLLDDHLSRVVDGRDAQPRALLLAKHLPRHDVRVVLQVREDDLVVRADELAPVALHDQVDRVGHVRREDDLAVLGGIEVALHLAPRLLVGLGRGLREGMHAAMDVRVLPLTVADQPVDDLPGHLARGAVVEVDERLAVRPDVAEDREVGAQALDVERRGRTRGGALERVGAHAMGSSSAWVCSSTALRRLAATDAIGIRSTISAAKP